jgi:lactosylceramide 4-alpha-galactosyltransferase
MKQVLAFFFALIFFSLIINLIIGLKKSDSIILTNFFKQNLTNKMNEPFTKYNIIFIETNKNREYFTERELCAVESAALNNPNGEIIVYSVKAKLNQLLLNLFSNVKLYKLDFDEIIKNTVFEQWFKLNSKLLLDGPSPIEHSSDILRIVLLWKLGGYYADLDTITLKSIEKLLLFNGFSVQSDNPLQVNNANIIFSKEHPLLLDLMQLMTRNYDPNNWTGLGQHRIIELLRNKCSESMDKLMIYAENLESNKSKTMSCGLHLFSQKFFAPYNWFDWKILFQRNQSLEIHRFINAYAIHFYSKKSEKETYLKNSNSIFEFYAKTNCPISHMNFFKK